MRVFSWLVALTAWTIKQELTPRQPALDLCLTPTWSNSSISTIRSELRIQPAADYHRSQAVLKMTLKVGPTPHMDYSGRRALRATDEAGPLGLTFRDEQDTATRTWHADRDTRGLISVRFEGEPRHVDLSTPPGPRSDMLINSGGIVSAGLAFVPVVLPSDAEETTYDLTLEWDLSKCPESTQAVWTFGEGQRVVKPGGTSDDLVTSIYMVSPRLQSWTSPDYPDYGFYWLTPPPAHLIASPSKLAESLASLFTKMAGYYDDAGASYRVFLRTTPRGYGGSAFLWSFVLQWDEGVRVMYGMDEQDKEDERFFLLSHEMVHNWPVMDSSRGDQESPESTVYTEGIAEYHCSVVPFELGLISPARFIGQINRDLSAYYTSPAINMTAEECTTKAWSDTHAQRLPYYRGMLYLMHLDAEVRRLSNGTASLRDPVLELLKLRRAGKPFGFDAWSTIMRKHVGGYGRRLFDEMSAGGWAVPPPDPAAMWGINATVVQHALPLYERGFEVRSKNGSSIVRDVVPGSNAAKAGLRDGDVLTWSKYSLVSSMDAVDAPSLVTVRRDGEEIEIEWTPRSAHMVPAWQIELL